MQKRVLEYMKEHHMTAQNDTVRVALSGGADSVCLLKILSDHRETLGITLKAVHVHHGLRAESDAEQEFVTDLCKTLEIPVDCEKVDVTGLCKAEGLGTEEAARRLRYEIFEKYATNGEKVALAHHENDQAETVLFHLFRGSGVTGLAGMAPVRDSYIRPLLCVSRAEIEAYLEKEGLSHVTDESNFDTAYARNRIRHDILPTAEEMVPGATTHIATSAAFVREADGFLRSAVKKAFTESVETGDGYCRIDKKKLLSYDPYLTSMLIYEMIAAAGGKKKDISRVHVEDVRSLSRRESGHRIDLIYDLEAVAEQEDLWIRTKGREKEKPLPKITMRVFAYEAGMEIPTGESVKWFDFDKIKETPCLRHRKEGDYLYCAPGQKQKLQDYFVNAKIPLLMRDEIALLAEGSHILWVTGYRISAYYKITEETRQVLEVCYDG